MFTKNFYKTFLQKIFTKHFYKKFLQNIFTKHFYKKVLQKSIFRYDTQSSMHYGPYTASRNGKPTMVLRKTGKPVKMRLRTTSLDVLELCILYECSCAKPKSNEIRFCGDGNFNMFR